jgi:hypothetical protein
MGVVTRFDPKRLRVERVHVEATYHAAYSFYGLKGAIAERWAHGPVFGAVGEAGSGQLNMTPATGSGDDRLVGVLGIRASAVLGEGKRWAASAPDVAEELFKDIYTALKPKRTVAVKTDLFGLYPIRDPYRASQLLRARYYQDKALLDFAGTSRPHAAVEVFVPDDQGGQQSLIMGVYGPPHQGLYLTFPDKDRDAKWWMGIRIVRMVKSEEGINDPLATISQTIEGAMSDWSRISRDELPAVVV